MSRNIKVLDRQFVPAGKLVIEQGTLGNRAFMIESGRVEVFTKDSKGNELVITELGAESMFGEMAVMADGMRSASVRTIEDCILITIPAYDLQKSMRTSEGLCNRLMKMVFSRAQDTSAKLLKKERELASGNKGPLLTVRNVALHISDRRQDQFKREILPLLRKIQATLEKFHNKKH